VPRVDLVIASVRPEHTDRRTAEHLARGAAGPLRTAPPDTPGRSRGHRPTTTTPVHPTNSGLPDGRELLPGGLTSRSSPRCNEKSMINSDRWPCLTQPAVSTLPSTPTPGPAHAGTSRASHRTDTSPAAVAPDRRRPRREPRPARRTTRAPGRRRRCLRTSSG
jgi:hypothetical protein